MIKYLHLIHNAHDQLKADIKHEPFADYHRENVVIGWNIIFTHSLLFLFFFFFVQAVTGAEGGLLWGGMPVKDESDAKSFSLVKLCQTQQAQHQNSNAIRIKWKCESRECDSICFIFIREFWWWWWWWEKKSLFRSGCRIFGWHLWAPCWHE